MQELDSQRIEEFGFTDAQVKELLGNFQKNLLVDFEQIRALCQRGESKALISNLHAFKGMVSLFSKQAMVDRVAIIEAEAQAQPELEKSNVAEQLKALHAQLVQLHSEVQAYLIDFH